MGKKKQQDLTNLNQLNNQVKPNNFNPNYQQGYQNGYNPNMYYQNQQAHMQNFNQDPKLVDNTKMLNQKPNTYRKYSPIQITVIVILSLIAAFLFGWLIYSIVVLVI